MGIRCHSLICLENFKNTAWRDAFFPAHFLACLVGARRFEPLAIFSILSAYRIYSNKRRPRISAALE